MSIAPSKTSQSKSNRRTQPSGLGRIGAWQLVRLLHQGNMTRVYQARPQESSEAGPGYVLKMLRKEWWRDEHAIAMQRREAWIGARLKHPNVLPVLSVNVQQPPFYLVTPQLTGMTLAQRAEEKLSNALPFVLWVIRQTAEALHALHKQTRMIHGDVKPENIFVSPQGHTTLLDFGLAQSPSEATQWDNQPVVGTLPYMAPEMVTSKLSASPQSDLYSLGVTLYQTLSGSLPLESNDPSELVIMQREAAPKCIRDRCPGLPKPVASLVHQLLSKDPMRRPHSANEVAQRLVRLEIDSFACR